MEEAPHSTFKNIKFKKKVQMKKIFYANALKMAWIWFGLEKSFRFQNLWGVIVFLERSDIRLIPGCNSHEVIWHVSKALPNFIAPFDCQSFSCVVNMQNRDFPFWRDLDYARLLHKEKPISEFPMPKISQFHVPGEKWTKISF